MIVLLLVECRLVLRLAIGLFKLVLVFALLGLQLARSLKLGLRRPRRCWLLLVPGHGTSLPRGPDTSGAAAHRRHRCDLVRTCQASAALVRGVLGNVMKI